MPDYYNSYHIQTGDLAKQKGDYRQALASYEKHLRYLEQEAKRDPRIEQTFAFHDAYALYLMNILHASAQNAAALPARLRTTPPADVSLKDVLADIQSDAFFLNMMDEYVNAFRFHFNKAKSVQKGQPSKLNISMAINTFRAIAKIADRYSDKIGELEGLEDLDVKQKIALLNAAAKSMRNTIILLDTFNPGQSGVKYHLSHLMYLESLYNETGDESYLKQMEQSLQFDNGMVKKTPDEALELIVYRLLVNTVLHQASDDSLIKTGNHLIEYYGITGETRDDFKRMEQLFFETELPPLSDDCFDDDVFFATDDSSPRAASSFSHSFFARQHSPVITVVTVGSQCKMPG